MKKLKVGCVATLAGLLVVASALAFIMAVIWSMQLGAEYIVCAFGALLFAMLARWVYAISDKMIARE